MKGTASSLYHSRTETADSVVIVWKPFSTYSTYVLLAIALIGSFTSITLLSLGAFLLLFVNAVIYSSICKEAKNEIKEASRNSSVQVKGNKFSLSAPLTVTIPKNGQRSSEVEAVPAPKKKGSMVKKVFFGFFAAIFLILGLFIFSTLMMGIRQSAYIGSLIILLVLALIFFLLAFLCYKVSSK